MRVYLPLTSIAHTHTQTEVFTHRSVPPPALSRPNVDLFTWPPGICLSQRSIWSDCPSSSQLLCLKDGPMLTLLFSNKQVLTQGKDRLLDWMCLLHVPISNFSHERSVQAGTKCMPGFFCLFLSFCGTTRNPSQVERGSSLPSLFFARQPQVLCELCGGGGGGPESVRCLSLCLVQRCRGCVACETCIHCSVVELNRARKALQAWETERQTKTENERDSKGRRGRLSTMEFRLHF